MQHWALVTLRGSACSIRSMLAWVSFLSSVVWFGISFWLITELHKSALVTGQCVPGITEGFVYGRHRSGEDLTRLSLPGGVYRCREDLRRMSWERSRALLQKKREEDKEKTTRRNTCFKSGNPT